MNTQADQFSVKPSQAAYDDGDLDNYNWSPGSGTGEYVGSTEERFETLGNNQRTQLPTAAGGPDPAPSVLIPATAAIVPSPLYISPPTLPTHRRAALTNPITTKIRGRTPDWLRKFGNFGPQLAPSSFDPTMALACPSEPGYTTTSPSATTAPIAIRGSRPRAPFAERAAERQAQSMTIPTAAARDAQAWTWRHASHRYTAEETDLLASLWRRYNGQPDAVDKIVAEMNRRWEEEGDMVGSPFRRGSVEKQIRVMLYDGMLRQDPGHDNHGR